MNVRNELKKKYSKNNTSKTSLLRKIQLYTPDLSEEKYCLFKSGILFRDLTSFAGASCRIFSLSITYYSIYCIGAELFPTVDVLRLLNFFFM